MIWRLKSWRALGGEGLVAYVLKQGEKKENDGSFSLTIWGSSALFVKALGWMRSEYLRLCIIGPRCSDQRPAATINIASGG